MKPTLTVFVFSVLLASCTQYQYLTVSGVDVAKNAKNELVSENDTLRIQYHFTGYKGSIGISIFNKSSQPLEIDWKKSAIIVEGKAWSYFNPNATLTATLEDSLQKRSANWVSSPTYIASLNGSILINEPTQFIPPSSAVFKVPLALPIVPFQNLPDEQAQKEAFQWAEGVSVSYKKMSFAQAASPLQFRSYLTFMIGGTGSQKEFSLEHRFFISEVWKTAYGPDNFPETLIKRADRFYLQP